MSEAMQDVKPALEKKFDKLREPFAAFISAQATASGFLLFALLAAMFVANSPLADQLAALQSFKAGFVFGGNHYVWSLQHLVNDGLIAIFFFLIGLEIKRELLAGELQDRRRVALLLSAALGGMLVPAGLYLLINTVSSGGILAGWGIPMATDTALAIGVLVALAARVPRSVVAFLVGVAIIDDIGAILVIALVYTEQLDWPALLAALGAFATWSRTSMPTRSMSRYWGTGPRTIRSHRSNAWHRRPLRRCGGGKTASSCRWRC
jgi:NhaA family Na+:H+ antiporter